MELMDADMTSPLSICVLALSVCMLDTSCLAIHYCSLLLPLPTTVSLHPRPPSEALASQAAQGF